MTAARSALLLVLLLGVVAPREAAACASCGCGDPTLTANGVELPYHNRVRLAVDERYGALSSGADAGMERAQFVRTSLAVAWSPWRRLTLALMLPWVDDFIARAGQPQQAENALGDLELSARVVVFQERAFAPQHLLWLSGGLKMPTGYRAYDADGYPFPDDDQAGTGSWDPFFGVTYAWFSQHLLSVFVSSSYRQTTPGWHGYRRGEVLGVSAAVQLQPVRWAAVQLGVEGGWTAADTLPNGAPSPNTGGTVGYVAPAVLFNPVGDLLVRLVVDAPVFFVPNGMQTLGTQVGLTLSYDVH